MKKLDNNTSYSRGLDGTDYLPGCVGLNNIKCTDYVNVIIQALCRVPDLRDFFIFYENKKYTSDVFDFKTLLSKRFSELIRKIWNPRNFKGHVSPHELLQAISIRSDKKFRLDQQSDPIKLLAWWEFLFIYSANLKKVVEQFTQGNFENKTWGLYNFKMFSRRNRDFGDWLIIYFVLLEFIF